MHHLADDIIGDSIVAEMTPFYFREDGREYMESVPFVYVKNLISTTADYLELHRSYVHICLLPIKAHTIFF